MHLLASCVATNGRGVAPLARLVTGAPSYSVTEALGQAFSGEGGKSPPHTASEAPGPGVAPTQPLRRDEDSELGEWPPFACKHGKNCKDGKDL